MEENPEVTQVKLMEGFDLSRKQIQRLIKDMREEGLVERRGSNRSGCMSTRRSGLPLAATREKIYIALILFALFVADLISDRDMRYVMMRKYSSSGMQQGKCFNGLTKSMIPHYPCHRM